MHGHSLAHFGITKLSVLLFAMATPVWAYSQIDTLPAGQVVEDILEQVAEETETEEIEFNTLLEDLDNFHLHPLDINSASEDDLSRFPFLSPLQIVALLDYRARLGPFISIYELQAVPTLEVQDIKSLLPFIKVSEEKQTLPRLFRDRSSQGQHLIILRWGSIVERSKGFSVPESDTISSRYFGDPNRLYLRYSYTLGRHIRVGFSAEKDAGEAFFKKNNHWGFDYYSAHLFVRPPPGGRLRTLALGDFQVALGQGLVIHQGFSTGKSSLTNSVKKVAPVFRPHTSVNEVEFQRGVAGTFALSEKLELSAFASITRRDANLSQPDDLPNEEAIVSITSLQTSGLHRTAAEIEDKNGTRQTLLGTSLGGHWQRFGLRANFLHTSLSKPLSPSPRLYNQFFFRGSELWHLSVDYQYSSKNAHFFGETARSNNGSIATLNGLLLSLGRPVEVSLLHRYFPKDYQSLFSNVFAESRTARNETGTYAGITIQPTARWRINAYYDQWHNPWPRFGNDAPAFGNELLGRLTYTLSKKLEAYLQIKREHKDQNVDSELFTSPTLPRVNTQLRVHITWQIGRGVVWRSRIDLGRSEHAGRRTDGLSMLQDLLYRPPFSRFSMSLRYAVFSTGSYDVRFYHYENDVMYSFAIPAYFNNGRRYYLNLRYKFRRGPRLELRYARSFFPEQESIGSGLDEIPGNTKTELKCQLFWQL